MSNSQKSKQYRTRLFILRIEEIILVVSAIILIVAMVYLKTYMRNQEVFAKSEELQNISTEENLAVEIEPNQELEFVWKNPIVGIDSDLDMTSDEADLIIKDAIREQEAIYDTDTEYEWLGKHKGIFPKEKVEAAEGNAGLIHFLYEYGNNEYTLDQDFLITDMELTAEIPLFMQWDERWGYEPYGGFNIGISGCGPTCLSMILIGFTKDPQLNPLYISDYAMKNGYYMSGTGTMWSLFSNFSSKYGVTCTDLHVSEDEIIGELEQGHPVILSMRRGQFTRAGHFIVLTKIENGMITINDPNNLAHSERLWDYKEFSKEIAHAWSFTM